MQTSHQPAPTPTGLRLGNLQHCQHLPDSANDDDLRALPPRLHRVSDDAMRPAGIRRGDMLSIEQRAARDGDAVLVHLNGRVLVRRLRRLGGQTLLLADHQGFLPCYVLDSDHFELLGVVSGRFRL